MDQHITIVLHPATDILIMLVTATFVWLSIIEVDVLANCSRPIYVLARLTVVIRDTPL